LNINKIFRLYNISDIKFIDIRLNNFNSLFMSLNILIDDLFDNLLSVIRFRVYI